MARSTNRTSRCANTSQHADLLGAIRLPNDAFKKNANTEVTTDMVMLRKRLSGESTQGPGWKSIAETTNSLGEVIALNEYFAERPEMMLGELQMSGKMYQRGEPTLVGNGRELAEQLAEAIALLPKDVFRSRQGAVDPPPIENSFPVPEHVKPSAYAIINGELAIRDADTMRFVSGLPAQTAQRIRGLIRVRDAVRRCLRSQLEATDESDVSSSREQLNQTYDHFIARQGFI